MKENLNFNLKNILISLIFKKLIDCPLTKDIN